MEIGISKNPKKLQPEVKDQYFFLAANAISYNLFL